MAHVSYSEIKNWHKCPYYHKLTYLDNNRLFKGNAYTAFGTAMHDTCEVLLEEKKNKKNNISKKPDSYFRQRFEEHLDNLPEDVVLESDLVEGMYTQGNLLANNIILSLDECFDDYEVISIEEKLLEPIKDYVKTKYDFKGYIDLVIKTQDGKYHIIDWKTCSWGWDSRRKSDKITNYQLTLYKYYFANKYNIDPSLIETHFALLKRTAKKNIIEIFRVTSGKQKTENAVKLIKNMLYNVTKKNYIKNRMACKYCEFYKTEYCP